MQRDREQGITLLEILLVLAIASMLLIMGIRQYLSFRTESEARRIVYNVDSIFLGMSYYYKAECYGRRTGSNFKPGKLNPDNSNYQENIPIDVQNDLIGDNYIRQALTFVPLVDASGGLGTNGYVAQFNMDDSKKRKICVEGKNATGPDSSQGCDQAETIGTIVSAKAQVAVKMKDEKTARTYLYFLGGDCLSNASGSIVEPCSAYPGTGTYIVWERLPSYASPEVQTSYSSGNVVVNQFTQEYTTYPVTYLLSTKGEMPSGDKQYFLCGS